MVVSNLNGLKLKNILFLSRGSVFYIKKKV